mgnify:FL=1
MCAGFTHADFRRFFLFSCDPPEKIELKSDIILDENMTIINSTPIKDGFRMPGEFEKHAGCWMAWPERCDLWYDKARPAQKSYAQVAAAIARFEPVTMCVLKKDKETARNMLPASIRILEMEYDDAWMRDIGPTFVTNGKEIRGVHWNFNSWGGFLPSWEKDKQVGQKILETEQMDGYKQDMVLEGGSIHTDGDGTLITTEECLLHPTRNPQLSKQEIEESLKNYLNVQKIIWLPKGVYMDDVNGHVDNLCCFIKPGVIALAWTDDKKDPQYKISLEAFEILRNSTDAKGRTFEIHKIHLPKPLFTTVEECASLESIQGKKLTEPGKRLTASYINFYPASTGVVIPSFGDSFFDQKAQSDIQELFPERKVVAVPARNIVLGGGGIHCITLQQPSIR